MTALRVAVTTKPNQDPQPLSLRIFLASPGDVAEERKLALEVIEALNYAPLLADRITVKTVAWDKFGPPMQAGLTPQEAINQGLPKPSACDIAVVIFWSRMGTPLPPEYAKPNGTPYCSGTEWEYWDALNGFKAHGKPTVLVYRRSEKVAFDPDDPEYEEKGRQWRNVKAFFSVKRAKFGTEIPLPKA